MWHIMVYSSGFDYQYSRPYAVHIFTDKKLPPEEAFRLAEEILTKTFPRWSKNDELKYVGYENIPVDMNIDGFYYVATKLDVDDFEFKVKGVASTVPPELALAIEEYRKRFITLDYDDDEDSTRARLLDALEYLAELGCRTRVFRTQRGYHVRAELPSPLSLEKILETREELDEDYPRISVDKAYMKKSLGFLTNLLFNSKCWVTANTIECYEEKEIDASSITTVRVETISIPLPAMKIELPKGTIEIDGKQIKFIGRFTARDVRNIAMSIEDNLWEYAYARKTSDDDIKAKLVKAYGKISSFLARLIEKCDVRVENGVVVIHVPESLQQYVGRLIGKQGANIRAVESELGMRIRIERTSPPPEDVAIRKRLQELLKNLAEG
ncbi:MAG: KH domain-containing protein [Sulfolobales archaeon]